LHLAVLLVTLFAVGMALGSSGRVDALSSLAADVYRAYAQAQYIMMQARENVTADGRIEFAVMAEDEALLERFVAGRQDWSLRDSAVPGWQVVSTPQGQQEGLDLLRQQPFVRVAWRNRGLWVCH